VGHADVGVVPLRSPGSDLDADEAPPRVPQQIDLVLVEALAQVVGDREGVRDELLHRHGGGRDVRTVGERGATLVPPHDGEQLLKPCRVLVQQEVVRHPRPPVNPEQHRVGSVPTFDEHPLLNTVDVDTELLGHAACQNASCWVEEWPGPPGTPCPEQAHQGQRRAHQGSRSSQCDSSQLLHSGASGWLPLRRRFLHVLHPEVIEHRPSSRQHSDHLEPTNGQLHGPGPKVPRRRGHSLQCRPPWLSGQELNSRHSCRDRQRVPYCRASGGRRHAALEARSGTLVGPAHPQLWGGQPQPVGLTTSGACRRRPRSAGGRPGPTARDSGSPTSGSAPSAPASGRPQDGRSGTHGWPRDTP
jgi:hypothetical protein